MTVQKRVWRAYLAGPEVFMPDPAAAATRLRALCAHHGIIGIFPLDGAVKPVAGEAPAHHAARIRAANLDLIRGADLVLANASPFRGPSADDGTAYEMGFATALSLPVFAYADTTDSLLDRTRARMAVTPGTEGDWRDPQGWTVEDFGLGANLMLVDPALARWGQPAATGLYPDAEAATQAAADWITAQTSA
ncbi:MAG: nucleoside 2-deoxyribosyltransferase [Azospirillaceae bacterium]|nr:nucleoside 2-deoxyribosyltransferase [Azospirillaceae bacterium]